MLAHISRMGFEMKVKLLAQLMNYDWCMQAPSCRVCVIIAMPSLIKSVLDIR